MSKNLDLLKRKRTVIKLRISNFKAEFEKIINSDSINLEVIETETKLNHVESTFNEFNKIQSDIELKVDIENLEQELQERYEVENLYFAVTTQIKHFLNTKSQSKTIDKINSSVEQQSIKLPTIKLPIFDGSYGNWLEFRDTYISLIHENPSISDIQKFHYLRAALKDNASAVISSIEFSSANYNLAWEALFERFNNENVLISNHISSLLDLASIKGSSDNLKDLVDKTTKHIRSLKLLNQPVEHWDTIIIQIVSRKLDLRTVKEWEEYKIRTPNPTFEDFRSFLINRAIMLESIEKTDKRVEKGKPKPTTKGVFLLNKTNSCSICNEDHLLYECKNFLSLSPQKRLEKMFRSRLCLNCLKPGHVTKNCLSGSCRKCRQKHNSLLHGADFSKLQSLKQSDDQNHQELNLNVDKVSANHSYNTNKQVLLPTVLLNVISENGSIHKARALIDSGAQGSFITEALVQKLQLKPQKTHTTVIGLSSATTNVSGVVSVQIGSLYSKFSTKISCLVLPKITGFLPSNYINMKTLQVPKVKLADPSFDKPGPIDLLIGSDLFWRIIWPSSLHIKKKYPYLTNTVFGWVIAGPIDSLPNSKVHCKIAKIPEIQELLQRFWEVENVSSSRPLSSEEIACENHFVNNTVREADGRFKVRIPFKNSLSLLGDSKYKARKQFLNLEKKLQNDKKLKNYYIDFLREYQQLGHMVQISEEEAEAFPSYYMPHHGVLKEDRSTTKLRVVFNASMATTTGYSLNDLQYTGPKIQEDIFSIAVRFRMHQIAISADIRKMYRQVKVDERDCHLQKLFWRESPNHDLKIFKLTTVTYGTTAGSFLAIRCLKELANEHKESHPEISSIIESDFYVDDLLTGTSNLEDAKRICLEVTEILKKGCFELQKWKSNESQILTMFSAHSSQEVMNLSKDEKTLGLFWSSKEDILMFKIKWENFGDQKTTKRSVLSNVSKIFDPLGLISPCILYAKILLQKLWLLKLSWDDPLPEEPQKIWSKYLMQLPKLNELKIPRKVVCAKVKSVQLHCFSDASQIAYGGCIYIRSENDRGEVTVRLLCSKGRVAPLKTLTVPKLELCGAHVVAKLLDVTIKSLKWGFDSCTLWTDSTIVLGWLKTTPSQLKTFVSNRVAEIQDITQEFVWKHIETKFNPADLLSRGISPDKLEGSKLWWEGPEFLKLQESEWPKSLTETSQVLPELKQDIQTFTATKEEGFEFNRFSSLIKLKRTSAYIFRFKNNCLSKERKIGNLSVEEINSAFQKLIKTVQRKAFESEIKSLEKNQNIDKKSKILSLTPFVDSQGLLRVGGRLKNSNCEFDKKHPVLLPSNHHLSQLILRHQHLALYHAGPTNVLYAAREKYWIISARNLVKQIINSCVQCRRYNTKPLNPIMGELPAARVTAGYPFQITGVDYAGPFIMKIHKGRGSKTTKAWICLFICLKTRAIHLELVTGLTSDEFMAAFRRFLARRGKPMEIYSDNGTNFVGASRELKRMLSSETFRSNISDATTTHNIKWQFLPPKTPHMGGIWEAGVKSCKRHLLKIIGKVPLTFEEFYTILTEIEAILNSRPLTPLSADPNDLCSLTPAHFLIGRSITALPDSDVTCLPMNKLSRYQFLNSLSQHFWKRWQKEYVGELQQRVKWKTNQPPPLVGELFLIKEDNLPPKLWCLGRIVRLHPGKDGIVRVADIRTSKGILRRPLTKLCPLLDN